MDTKKCPAKQHKTPKRPPLQFKRGMARSFQRENPILVAGQPAVELDTHKLKIGDGFTKWNDLPYISNGTKGRDGKSAYQLWKEFGHNGTVNDFLESLIGPEGKSTYQIWLEAGNSGDEADFILDMQGMSAFEVWRSEGNEGTVVDYLQSLKGKSAYELWLELGNEGDEDAFIEALRGPRGYSTYELWLQAGHTGDMDEFLEAMRGKSAYEQYVESGGKLSEENFMKGIDDPVQWGTF